MKTYCNKVNIQITQRNVFIQNNITFVNFSDWVALFIYLFIYFIYLFIHLHFCCAEYYFYINVQKNIWTGAAATRNRNGIA